MIKAITFDLDGVYFPNGKANFLKALEDLGVIESEAKHVFLKSPEMNDLYKTGKWSDEQYWGWAADKWHLPQPPEVLMRLLIESYDVDPDVEAFVKTVRHQGYKTLVCSNNFPARVDGLQARFRFLDNFDAAVFSYEVAAVKPSRAIFDELIKRAAVPAQSIAFADDNQDNLEGAEAAGISAFLYEDFDQFAEHLRSLGVTA